MTACTRCASALEDGDLRCAICALPTPSVPRLVPTGRQASVLRCSECNAAMVYAPEAARCAFCGAPTAIEQPSDPLEVARLRLPFTVDRAAAEAALRGWLARRRWWAPSAVSREAALEALTPLAWAAWLVDADALVTWTADSDEGARRARWAPHAGETALGFRRILVSASRGLRDAECRMLAPHYALASAVPVATAGSAGEAPRGVVDGEVEAVIEQFDAQRSAARARVQARISAAAKVRVRRHIPGRRFRNVHVACLVQQQVTERVVLPAWVCAYRYRGVMYRAIVHGQRAEVVLGRAPIDWQKIGRGLAVILVIALAVIAIYVRR